MIYLDYNATTPIAPPVREAMLPFLAEYFGNPSSSHSVGQAARDAIEEARFQVAQLLGTAPACVVFTSGGTESNNLAVLGVLLGRVQRGNKTHLIISALEHPAVVAPARYLERLGCAVTIVRCSQQGLVNADDVAAQIRPETALVSVMHANNEIGTIQPIRAISDVCRERGIPIHTDAAQTVGKIPALVEELGVDLLSLSSHKFYGPKGVGALFIRPGVQLDSILHGASQERGLRPGTENVASVVGLGAASSLAGQEMTAANRRMTDLRDRLQAVLKKLIGPGVRVNGDRANRLPNTLSVNLPLVRGSKILAECPGICASTGAACHGGVEHASECLLAIGLSHGLATHAIRFSVGRPTSECDIDAASRQIYAAWRRLSSEPSR